MYLHKIAAITAVTGMSALMLMGNTKCGAGISGGGATALPVYAGLGAAPAGISVHLPGTWIYSGGRGKTTTWIFAGATGAGIALAAIRSTGKKAADARYRVSNQIINHPCQNQKQNHKIARWPAKAGTHLGGQDKNSNPYLDCKGLGKLMSDHGVPARIKYIYDCIAKIIAEGKAYTPDWGETTWGWNGGWVTANLGRIKEMQPALGGWGACARAQ